MAHVVDDGTQQAGKELFYGQVSVEAPRAHEHSHALDHVGSVGTVVIRVALKTVHCLHCTQKSHHVCTRNLKRLEQGVLVHDVQGHWYLRTSVTTYACILKCITCLQTVASYETVLVLESLSGEMHMNTG